MSLREAQHNFATIGLSAPLESIHDPLETRLRGYERDPNWRPLPPPGSLPPPCACPCCGYLTIGGDWDTCRVCFWEVDPEQQENPDRIGANRVTLHEAQRNFQKSGCVFLEYAGDVEPIEKRTAPFLRSPNWKPLA